jgi:TonB-linked SusC/RagA family outer membrane protein
MQDFATLDIIAIRRDIQLLETAGFHRTNACAQLKRVMRLTGILILIACLHVSANGITQTINLSFENAPLETVLKDIEKQTGYTFFYRTNWVKQAKKITVKASNLTLQRALELCFKEQPVVYSISGKIITITLKTDKIPAENTDLKSSILLIDVKGKIVGEDGRLIEGVNIIVKGTNHGTSTNERGEFFLKNVDENAVLIISSVGYDKLELPISGKTFIALQLKITVGNLDEFQVIAYGQTTKRFNTGNVSTVKASEIGMQPVSNPLLALQGRVPGLIITQVTGIPGTGVKFEIRGKNSIAQGNDPLFIIDGVPYPASNIFLPNNSGFLGYGNSTPGSPLDNIDPGDIESITVLKDADATAIYGSRGSNGVVLITTKKGKGGETKIDLNAQSGWGKVTSKLDLLNTRQYLDMRYEALKNDGVTPNANADYDLTLWDTTRFTDWQKRLIGGTSHYNQLKATASGGNMQTQYLIGSGYIRETTVFPGDFYDNKGSLNFNINNSSINKKLRISLSGMYTINNNKSAGIDFTELAIKTPPNAPSLYNADGSLNWAPNVTGASTWPDATNPIANLFMKYKIKTHTLVSNASIEYELMPCLAFKSSFGYNNIQSNTIQTVPHTAIDPFSWPTRQRASLFANSSTESWIIEPQLDYSKKFKKINISALLGATIQQNRTNGESIEARGFNSDLIMEDLKSASSFSVLYSNDASYKYAAIFGRINAKWDDKYLVNLTGRRDGSSRFGPANRFHNFWAVGGGWIFSKEDLIRDIAPVLSFGKLRMSYGATGSDLVGDYSYLDLYYPINVGVSYQGNTGLAPYRILAPDLAWEETKKLEAAIEIGLFKDRVFITLSSYRNRSSNQLLSYSLPAITGFTSIAKNLNAKVENKGIEIELKTENIKSKSFNWSSYFNFSLNRNKLLSGAEGLLGYYDRKIGNPLSSNFLFHLIGVDVFKGGYVFLDANGAETKNPSPDDLKTLVDPSQRYYGGIQNSIGFKQFELDFLFQYVKRPEAPIYLYNYIPGYFGNGLANQPITVLNRWQKPGDVARVQRFSQNNSLVSSYSNASVSDQVYGDASFIRLKNVSLSWQAPKELISKLHLKSFRLYTHIQNLLTITKYIGLDPETLSSTSLPPLRIITVGMQLTF